MEVSTSCRRTPAKWAARPGPRCRQHTPRPTSPPQRLSGAAPRATWQDYLPRIVDSIPRRLPVGGGDGGGGVVDLAGAADALRRLVFPESTAEPASLTWGVLVFASLAVGLAVEAASIALKALPPPNGDGEGGTASGGTAPPSPATPPAAEPPATPMRAKRSAVLRDRVKAERYRGLAWLAGLTFAAVWVSGLMGKDNALMP